MARYLAGALPAAGWEATIATGSLGPVGEESNAVTFYQGLDVRPLDYTPRPRPRIRSAPTLPSSPPTRIAPTPRTRSTPAWGTRTSSGWWTRWSEHLARSGAAEADVLHLHHLTPINEAAERSFPDVPRVGHLHGTELLMLRQIDDGPPEGWDHAEAWAERMRRWARSCERLFVLSPDAVRRVPDLLGVERRTRGVGAQRLRSRRVHPPAGLFVRARGPVAALAGG